MGIGYPKGWRLMSTSLPVKNNGATVMEAGNIDGSNVTQAPASVAPNKIGLTLPGPRLRSGTAYSISSSAHWNTTVAGNYFVKGGSHMSSLGGVANTLLNTSARLGVGPRGINHLEYRTGFRIISWDLLTGLPTKGTIAIHNNFGSDTAATPSSAIPGYLAYTDGSANPTSGNYQPRYLW